jgi:6-phosphogluconolactonase (cycloisomerase 2 family)
VGGAVSGLVGSGLVLLNGGTAIPVAANGAAVVFATLASGTAYSFTVQTQPSSPTQSCLIANPVGTANANVTNVNVTCTTTTFTVGGNVTGLAAGRTVTLLNGSTSIPVTANGTGEVFATLPSGTAYAFTVGTQPTTPAQTCLITNPNGTVTTANIGNVNVNCTTNKYTVSAAIGGLTGTGLVLQDNGGDNLAETASGTYPFAITLLPGATYAVTVLTQPTTPGQFCTVTNGAGTVAQANITATVTCRNEGMYAFVADTGGSNVYSYAIDDTNGATAGALTQVGGAVAADGLAVGPAPAAIAVHPSGNFVFTANSGTADVSVFSVTAGALTWLSSASTGTAPTGPSPLTGSTPSGVAVDPSGNYVLVTDSNNDDGTGIIVDLFSFVATPTPTLTFVSTNTAASGQGAGASSVAVDPLDQYVFASNVFNSTTIGLAGWAFSTVAPGSLTPFAVPTVGTGSGAFWVAVDPLDRFVYVSNNLDGTVSGWTIGSGGALTSIGAAVPTGDSGVPQTGNIAIDPTGQFLYVTDTANAKVVGFTINQTTGALTLMTTGSPFTVGTGPVPVTIDGSGHFLYVGNSVGGDTISMFTTDPTTGVLTPITGSPLTFPGMGPNAIAVH